MLPGCVASLASALDGLASEILVIDNLPDGGAAAALSGYPVRLTTNTAPLGFSANLNAGARATTGRSVLFLNPDTRHYRGRMADALGFLDGNPGVGLIGCRLLNPDGTLQQSFRRFPSPAVPLRVAWRRSLALAAAMVSARSDGERFIRNSFPGRLGIRGFPLLRRADFERLGGMDEGFRLYYEDVDLAWRMRRAGLDCWVFPSLQFLHEHQRSSARQPFSRAWRWHVGSALRYFAKTLGRGGMRSRPVAPKEPAARHRPVLVSSTCSLCCSLLPRSRPQ